MSQTEETFPINWKLPILLGLSFIALVALAFYLEFKHRPAQEKQEELSKKIFQIPSDHQIGEMEIATGRAVHLMKCLDQEKKNCKVGDSATWTVNGLKADSANINPLINSMDGLQSSESIDLSNEAPEKQTQLLRDYGLDPATRGAPTTRHIRLNLQGADGKFYQKTVYFGANHPVGEAIFSFVEISGESPKPISYLAPSYFKSSLERDLTYWREKRLFNFAGGDVRSLSVRGPKSKKSLLEATLQDQSWNVRSGSESLAGDLDNIESFASAISYINAKDFATDSKESPAALSIIGKASPVIQIQYSLKKKGDEKEDPKPVSINFYEVGKKAYVTSSAHTEVFEVDPTLKDRLDKSITDLRASKLLTTPERFSTQVLEISGKGWIKPLLFENKDAEWKPKDAPAEVAGTKVASIIEKLSGNRIKEFVSASAVGGIPKTQDSLELKLGDAKTPVKRHYRIIKRGSEVWVVDLLSKRNEVFKVDPALATVLPFPPNKEGLEFFKKTQ